MSDVNHFVLTGRLTRDAEAKQFGESTLFQFSIAVNKYSRKEKKEVASFFDCKVWAGSEKQAAYYADNLKKGVGVVTEGSIGQDKWTDKEGKNQSKVVFESNSVAPMGGKKGGESSDSFPSDFPE